MSKMSILILFTLISSIYSRYWGKFLSKIFVEYVINDTGERNKFAAKNLMNDLLNDLLNDLGAESSRLFAFFRTSCWTFAAYDSSNSPNGIRNCACHYCSLIYIFTNYIQVFLFGRRDAMEGKILFTFLFWDSCLMCNYLFI